MFRTRTDLLNWLIEREGYRRYLEIGVRNPSDNFDRIEAEYKFGVDPDPNVQAYFCGTSDEFFESGFYRYDLIFIDGDHRWTTALRDVGNSLARLAPNGTIVMHDCLPRCKEHSQLTYGNGQTGNGTAWKAYAILRMSRPDLSMYMLDIPNEDGIGVIQKGRQNLFVPPDHSPDAAITGPDHELTWGFYVQHRESLLAPMSAKEFVDASNCLCRRV